MFKLTNLNSSCPLWFTIVFNRTIKNLYEDISIDASDLTVAFRLSPIMKKIC